MRLFESSFFAWFYMRFFMYREISDIHGDTNINFSFVSFFPEIMKPYLELPINILYEKVASIGLLPDFKKMATGAISAREKKKKY